MCFVPVLVDCVGGVHSELEGTISSPGYPDMSPHDLDCVYSISVEPGFIITLNFSETFHIEKVYNQGTTCLFHWLQVCFAMNVCLSSYEGIHIFFGLLLLFYFFSGVCPRKRFPEVLWRKQSWRPRHGHSLRPVGVSHRQIRTEPGVELTLHHTE